MSSKKKTQRKKGQNPKPAPSSSSVTAQQQPKGTAEAEGEKGERPSGSGSLLSTLDACNTSVKPGSASPAPGGGSGGGDSVSEEYLAQFALDPLSTRTRSKNPNPSLNQVNRRDWQALFIKDQNQGKTEAARLQSVQPQSVNPSTSPPGGESQPSSSSSNAAAGKSGVTGKTAAQKAAKPHLQEMSRNRARAAPAGESAEEVNLYQEIKQDTEKAKGLHDQQQEIMGRITTLKEKLTKSNSKPTIAEIDQLSEWHEQIQKLSREESDMVKATTQKMHILIAMRKHAENNGPSGKHRKRRPDTTDSAADSPSVPTVPVLEKSSRSKSNTNRSTSVSGTRAREGEAAEGTKGTVAEKDGQLFVGAEVVFKHNKKQHGMEGEGIQCNIKSITGEGNKKRYEVQDPEPIENGEEGAVYKTTATSLIPIPKAGTSLLSFPAGKQVLARYPDTTTFYRAEVVGSRKDTCRLRFEGEEDDKELEVDRRFVLDIPGK